MMDAKKILENINLYIDHMGFRKERLAKMMGKSQSSFYANLRGEHDRSIYSFSIELARVLGEAENFFMSNKMILPRLKIEDSLISFSVGTEMTHDGKRGLEQIKRICDLINIYN